MRKRGFTLIEVAIALAIFVVGALAVIRIFPPAFNVVQNSGYSNVATRLSDSILAQMKGDGSTPEAVFDIDDSGNWYSNPIEDSWQDPEQSVVGTVTKNASLPNGPSQSSYEKSALMRYRFIRGEKHDVQNADSTDPANPPYILTNFPYDSTGGVNTYIEMVVSGVTMDSGGHLDFSRATSKNPITGATILFNGANDSNSDSATAPDFYDANHQTSRPPEFLLYKPGKSSVAGWTNFINPSTTGLKLPLRSLISDGVNVISTGTRYYVSYRWTSGSGSNIKQGVVDEPLNIPADDLWKNDVDTYSVTSKVNTVLQGVVAYNNSNVHVVAGSVQVKVRVDLARLPGTADQAELGYLPFPILSDGAVLPALPTYFKLDTPVYLEYLVPDHSTTAPADQFQYGWRNIFDQSIANASNEVFLPVHLLDKDAVKAVAVDRNVSPNTASLPLAPDASNSDFTLGKLTFAGSANQQVRTSYRGTDGWARQVSVTAASYVPYVSSAAFGSTPYYVRNYSRPSPPAENLADTMHYYLPHEFWREYYWVPGSDTIYFHVSDAGKQMSVSFIDSTGKTWLDQVATIDKTPVATPATGFAATSAVPLQFIDPANPNNLLTISSVLGVRGVEIMARTAWLNGDKYEQAVVTGYRAANAD